MSINNLKIPGIKVLITGILMLFLFQYCYSQSILDTSLTFKIKDKFVSEALQIIGSDIGYDFSYNPDLIAINRKIKIEYKNKPLFELLNEIINDSTLTFTEVDKQIVIYKKETIQLIKTIEGFDQTNDFLIIKGHIIDGITGENLPFANMAILGKSLGSISNDNGYFRLKVPSSCFNESIVVSYMGYRNAVIPIKDLSIVDNKIYLEKDIIKLKEAIIRIQNPKELLAQSIHKINENYYDKPYNITGFYREYVKKKNELSSISEAVIKVYKSPYEGNFSDQTKLLKSRKNTFYSQRDTFIFKLQGGLYSSLFLDIIKNPPYFFSELYFHHFIYTLENITMYNNTTAYVIGFKPKYYLEDNSYEGKIYLNSVDLAVLAVEISISREALDKIGRSLVVKNARRMQANPESVNYHVNYRKIGDKYFLNMVRGELTFRVKRKRKLFSTNYKTVFELATHNVDTVDIERFERSEVIKLKGIFIDENYQYDNDFWGDYNYIIPNQSLEEALIRIQKKMDSIKNE